METASVSELLKLAEAYYAVSADLKRQAEKWLVQSQEMGFIADRICEENMRQGCTRSHPHENMNAECERLTEVARNAVSAGEGQ
jgi:hypothetical protein